MSKIAAYLQEHISGEVTTNPAILKAMSRDAGVLEITPEMVVYPRTTNDIRKVARFAWQLAEKGHVLPLTPRGSGTDQTGGAIGKGIILSLPAHMHHVFEVDARQKLVRLQPGVGARALNEALLLHRMAVPSLPVSASFSTIGGAVMKNLGGPLSGKYGSMGEWVSQLEVVLANGDVLQTERISKRELNKRKGMQTLEGEIYRNLDSLIEENRELIEEKLSSGVPDNVGYSSVARVKRKDGSFDLTPLIVGSQGTLGIVSEMIMKSEFMSASTAVAVLAFTDDNAARDALDQLRGLKPAFLDYYDETTFELAAARGKKYDFLKQVEGKPRAVLLVGFDDFSERARIKKMKKLGKLFKNADCYIDSADGEAAAELLAIREVTAFAVSPDTKDVSAPPIVDGAYVPAERFEEFLSAAATLASRHQVTLPFHARALENLLYARPLLHLHKVGDKQKVFKLLDEYSNLVEQYGGHLIGEGGEGRVKARFAYKHIDPEVAEFFASIKAIFDPHGILNPGVKQAAEMRQLVSHLRHSYDTADFASHVPYN